MKTPTGRMRRLYIASVISLQLSRDRVLSVFRDTQPNSAIYGEFALAIVIIPL